MSDQTMDSWSKYEAESKEQQTKVEEHNESVQQYKEDMEDFYPGRRFLHIVFIFYSFLTIVTACLLALGQFMGMTVEKFKDVDFEGPNEAIRYVVSLYIILMCIMTVMVEMELHTNSKILNLWITRGLVYIFIGVLALDQADLSTTISESELLFIQIMSYVMMGLGCGYSIMGVLCLQIVLNRFRTDYQARNHVARNKKKAGKKPPTPPSDIEMT